MVGLKVLRSLWSELLRSLLLPREGSIHGCLLSLLPPPALTWMLGSGHPRKSPAHQPSFCPASKISGQRAGKSHHWEENDKKVWCTCSVTPWGPGAPHPQKLPLTCSLCDTASLSLCHSTLLWELCGCKMCVKRHDNSCCCHWICPKTPTEIRSTLWRTCVTSPVVLFPAVSWESASTGQSNTKACKSLNSSLHQMWWIQVGVQEA